MHVHAHSGDLHGDFKKTQRAFRLAGLIDADDRWIGGNTVCVQVGSWAWPLWVQQLPRSYYWGRDGWLLMSIG